MLKDRQADYYLRVSFQDISSKISTKIDSKSVIKEIITEEKVPGTEEVIKTVHSGQLNIQ